MCEADSLILRSFGAEGRVNRTFIVIPDATLDMSCLMPRSGRANWTFYFWRV